jgi:hypothetical protein
VNANGFYEPDPAGEEETFGDEGCPFAMDGLTAAEHREAHQLLDEHAAWGPNDARRVLNQRRELAERDDAELRRRGQMPSRAQVLRGDALQKAAERHMATSGCDFSTGLRRALSEHRAIAAAYERG